MDDARVAHLRSFVSADLTPYYDTHFNLLRWIQGNPGRSLEKVAAKLRHHLRFRASSWDVDGIHERARDHAIHRHLPVTRCGLSRVIPNCIVHVDQSGYTDHAGMFENFSVTEIMKASIYDLEQMLARVMEIERETSQQASVLYVMDAEGVTNSKHVREVLLGPLKAVSEFMAEHYVELVKHIVVINVPTWAIALWAVMKPVMPEKTVEKVRLLSSSNWREEIHSFMDPSIGPTFWNNEKHSEFLLKMERPPKVPKREHVKTLEKSSNLLVKAGQEHWIDFNLEQGDEVAFKVTGNTNFGFAIVQDSGEEDAYSMRQLFPFISCVPGPLRVTIEDSVIAPHSGLYKVWFSNTHAWWSALTI
ncbi:hypothetical protein PMAYCL1PPCAC_04075, partial [Pristionchus mayeri]